VPQFDRVAVEVVHVQQVGRTAGAPAPERALSDLEDPGFLERQQIDGLDLDREVGQVLPGPLVPAVQVDDRAGGP